MAATQTTTTTSPNNLASAIGDFGLGVKIETSSILILTASIAALIVLLFACLYAYKKSI